MQSDSEHALIMAVSTELKKKVDSPLHGLIDISYGISLMANGIKCCNVQIQCQAGCGYLIMAFDQEADWLKSKAIATRSLLRKELTKDAPRGFDNIPQELVL